MAVGEASPDEEWLRGMLGDLANHEGVQMRPKNKNTIQMGEGLSQLVEKIQAGEFVEFSQFPVLN